VSRLTEILQNAWEMNIYRLMRTMPTEVASGFGSFLVRANVRFSRPEVIAGARRNLAIHHPDWSEDRIREGVDTFLDNVGRLMAEFATLHRLIDDGRMAISGAENITPYYGKLPLLGLPLHLGNWEATGPGLQMAGMKFAAFYDPPESPVQRKIAVESRIAMGFQLLEPDRRGLKEGMRLLGENKAVAIFPDEARRGKTMGPFFGRPPHFKGNLTIAAKLARLYNPIIFVTYIERKPKCHFVMHFSEAYRMPDAEKPSLKDDVLFLNNLIEPVILSDIERWYFLDDALEPVA
jgi:Kdo2-lipid IVA lauroyltransferase/acyltransferase